MKKTTSLFAILCFIIASLFFTNLTYSQAGSLDLTFSTDGKVTTAVGSGYDYGQSIAIQSDGKIVTAGFSRNGTDNDFTLVRYNTDGSLDTGFDTDGKVTTAIGTGDDNGLSVAIQADGKIVVAGYSYNGTNNDFAIVRYNNDGSLDTSFDTDGKVTTDFGIYDDIAYSVTTQTDGKIVVAGYAMGASNLDFALVRYNTDGSLDMGLDTDGKVTTDFGIGHDIAYSVAIQTDGNIVVAGYAMGASNLDFALVRYNTDGSLDTGLDTDGKVTTDFGIGQDNALSVAIQTDGNIVVAGYARGVSNNDFALVRYNSDGSLDSGFGTSGKVTTDFGIGNDLAYSVAIQTDGKIVLAGYAVGPLTYDFALVRYDEFGNLDSGFDSDGLLLTDLSDQDYGTAVAVQTDGKIVVAGRSFTGSNYDYSIARYNACDLPVITTEPIDISVCSNNNAIFNLEATDATAYQWQENQGGGFTNLSNGGVYSNVNNDTLDITGATVSMNTYTYRCIVSRSCSQNDTSSTVTLTVNSVNTITVINTNDAGAGSLRQAVIDANDCDIINFSVSGTITLTTGQISFNKSLTIQGPDSSTLAIDGNAADRIFEITGGSSSISGLTIQNGSVTADGGGGILISAGELSIDSCNISYNTASGVDGGGISNNGTLTISNSNILNNNASSGGGLYSGAVGTLNINDCTISNNSTTGSGGAIFVFSKLILNNSIISDNTATNGGGIYIIMATATIENSTISGNIASNAGAGLLVSWANLIMNKSTISGNNAGNDGGGIHTSFSSELTNCTLSGNTAGGNGGAIFQTSNGSGFTVTLMNTTLAYNSQGYYANIIAGTSFLITTNSIFSDNTSGNYGFSGAGTLNKTSNGYNLSSDATMDAFLINTGDLTSTDPQLNALADNGGDTQTHSIPTGSPAKDAGTDTGSPTTDQRGFSRLGTTDIGAFEYGIPVITTEPSNNTICEGSNVSFNVVAIHATGYQWQEDQGSGFSNLSNGGVYSNVTSATMNITSATVGMNAYQYRCIAIGVSINDTSLIRTLTVNASSNYYLDADSDAYGDVNDVTPTASCTAVVGEVTNNSDCDDSEAILNIPATHVTYYEDTDTDTYGDLASTSTVCSLTAPGGFVSNSTDCDDGNAAVHSAPVITSQPSDVLDLCDLYNTSFSVTANFATGYQWEVSTDNGVSWNNATGGIYSNETTATLTLSLVPSTYNNYKYRCVLSGGCVPNATSNEVLLTVRAPFTVPSTLSTTSIDLNNATLNWGNVAGATELRVALRKVGTTVWHNNNAVYADSYIFNSASGFSLNSNYEWKVRVKDANGCWSLWSTTETFYVCTYATPTALNETGIFSNKVTLNWSHPGADEVRIALRKEGNPGWYYKNEPFANSYEWNASFTKNANYEWMIRVRCGTTWGAWSALGTFVSGTVSGMIQQDDETITNIDADLTERNIIVYPNPNNGDFTISSTHEGTFKIVNELGQVIQTVELTKDNNQSVVTSENFQMSLQPGIYFITGTIEGEIITKKIIIQ